MDGIGFEGEDPRLWEHDPDRHGGLAEVGSNVQEESVLLAVSGEVPEVVFMRLSTGVASQRLGAARCEPQDAARSHAGTLPVRPFVSNGPDYAWVKRG
jgi:hypothetical protein